MYPIQCKAGYPMPIARVGKMKIIGVQATAKSSAAASQVTIVDDENIKINEHKFGNILTSAQRTERNCHVLEVKGVANVDGTIESFLPEPIIPRNGPSIYCSNIEGGTLKLYVA